MAEAKRCDLEAAIRDNVSPAVADSLALDVLPKQSLQALGDLLGVDEKTGHVDRVKDLLEKFALELTGVAQEEGQLAAIKHWNQTWPVVDANLCAIIEPLPDGDLRAELEAYYALFEKQIGDELMGGAPPEEDLEPVAEEPGEEPGEPEPRDDEKEAEPRLDA